MTPERRTNSAFNGESSRENDLEETVVGGDVNDKSEVGVLNIAGEGATGKDPM